VLVFCGNDKERPANEKSTRMQPGAARGQPGTTGARSDDHDSRRARGDVCGTSGTRAPGSKRVPVNAHPSPHPSINEKSNRWGQAFDLDLRRMGSATDGVTPSIFAATDGVRPSIFAADGERAMGRGYLFARSASCRSTAKNEGLTPSGAASRSHCRHAQAPPCT
jgi:hypothetical protein